MINEILSEQSYQSKDVLFSATNQKVNLPGCITLPIKIVKKKPWTLEEDQILVKLVDRFGAQKWSTIAANMPGKFQIYLQGGWGNNVGRGGITT